MCGDNPTVRELIDYEQFCGIRPAAQAAAASALPPEQEMTVEELKNALDRRVPLFVWTCASLRSFGSAGSLVRR